MPEWQSDEEVLCIGQALLCNRPYSRLAERCYICIGQALLCNRPYSRLAV